MECLQTYMSPNYLGVHKEKKIGEGREGGREGKKEEKEREEKNK